MDKEQFNKERIDLLSQINALFDFPLMLLSIIWLILIIIEFVYGLSPFLQNLNLLIWGIFIFDFFVELYIAPDKKEYLKKNWIVAFSLFLPALRILRLFTALRMIRFTTFVRSLIWPEFSPLLTEV
jgi:voltage-gated potassium channel